MNKRNVTKNLCALLLMALLIIILCMCAGCRPQDKLEKYISAMFAHTHRDVATDDIVTDDIVMDTAILDGIDDPATSVKKFPIFLLSDISTVEPTQTTEPPESIPTEPEPEPEPETQYYDVPLSEDLQDHIFALCEEHDIDPALVIAMIKRESNYKARAVGDKGNSLGLMQIQPRWHYERMDRLDCPDLLDPYQNVTVGIDILSDLFAKGKPVEWVLMAYNGGRAYANRNWNSGVVSSYASKVLDIRDNLSFKE